MKTILKAYKFRLKAKSEHEQKFVQFSGTCRFVWNKALKMNLDRLENKQKLLSYFEVDFWTKIWKDSEEYGFLKDCHSQIIQQTLKNLDKAFKDGFDKNQPLKRIPKFKKKGKNDSFRYPQGFKIDEGNKRVYLPKIGYVSYRKSRNIQGTPKNVTVSRKGKYWYVSIQTEFQQEYIQHPSKSIIGIDLGVKKFCTFSDGTYIEPINSLKNKSEKLKKLQRNLKNKKKFSKNWRKQQLKISNLHEKIANIRHDFQNKLSTDISKNHAIVVVEKLKVKNMSKSSKGNIDKHGKKVKQKSGLNKSILDQGWSTFISKLKYKLNWLNGELIMVDPKYTSQTCPCCGNVSKENRKTQEHFECIECGYTNNADVVGAINILTRGHRELACEVNDDVMSSAAGTIQIAA